VSHALRRPLRRPGVARDGPRARVVRCAPVGAPGRGLARPARRGSTRLKVGCGAAPSLRRSAGLPPLLWPGRGVTAPLRLRPAASRRQPAPAPSGGPGASRGPRRARDRRIPGYLVGLRIHHRRPAAARPGPLGGSYRVADYGGTAKDGRRPVVLGRPARRPCWAGSGRRPSLLTRCGRVPHSGSGRAGLSCGAGRTARRRRTRAAGFAP
jgi:hypothetical protein